MPALVYSLPPAKLEWESVMAKTAVTSRDLAPEAQPLWCLGALFSIAVEGSHALVPVIMTDEHAIPC